MPHLINLTVEVDTEYKSEAERFSHVLADDLTDYEGVTLVSVQPPESGTLDGGGLAAEGPEDSGVCTHSSAGTSERGSGGRAA